MAHLKTKSIMS